MQRNYRERLATSFGSIMPNGGSLRAANEFKLQELAMLSLNPLMRLVQRWWLQRAEQHYLMCADIEQQRAREAQMNVAYYQKRVAIARSVRI